MVPPAQAAINDASVAVSDVVAGVKLGHLCVIFNCKKELLIVFIDVSPADVCCFEIGIYFDRLVVVLECVVATFLLFQLEVGHASVSVYYLIILIYL